MEPYPTDLPIRFREPVPEARWEPEIRSRLLVAYGLVRHQRLNFERLAAQIDETSLVERVLELGAEEEAFAAEIASIFDPAAGPLERILTLEIATVYELVSQAQQVMVERVREIFDSIIVSHAMNAGNFFALNPTDDFGFEELFGHLPLGAAPKAPVMIPGLVEIVRYEKDTVGPATLTQIATAISIESLLVEELRHVMKVFRDRNTRELCAWFAITCSSHLGALWALADPRETPLERAIYSEVAEISGLERALRAVGDANIEAALTMIVEANRGHLSLLEEACQELEGGHPEWLTVLGPLKRPTITVADYVVQAAARLGIDLGHVA